MQAVPWRTAHSAGPHAATAPTPHLAAGPPARAPRACPPGAGCAPASCAGHPGAAGLPVGWQRGRCGGEQGGRCGAAACRAARPRPRAWPLPLPRALRRVVHRHPRPTCASSRPSSCASTPSRLASSAQSSARRSASCCRAHTPCRSRRCMVAEHGGRECSCTPRASPSTRVRMRACVAGRTHLCTALLLQSPFCNVQCTGQAAARSPHATARTPCLVRPAPQTGPRSHQLLTLLAQPRPASCARTRRRPPRVLLRVPCHLRLRRSTRKVHPRRLQHGPQLGCLA